MSEGRPNETSPTIQQFRLAEALNVVLDGSDYRAEDREDLRAEDFWIVGPDGDAAMAEVKGINSNVRRQDVNQLMDFSAARGGLPSRGCGA